MTDNKEIRLATFAAAALSGMLAHPRRYIPREQDKDMHWHDAIATEAYDIATAMNARHETVCKALTKEAENGRNKGSE